MIRAKETPLRRWLRMQGRGAIQRLHERAGVSLPVISRARDGNANLASAIRIHTVIAELGAHVPISSMTRDKVPAALRKRVA